MFSILTKPINSETHEDMLIITIYNRKSYTFKSIFNMDIPATSISNSTPIQDIFFEIIHVHDDVGDLDCEYLIDEPCLILSL